MNLNVEDTAKTIENAVQELKDASRELDLLARKMRESGDLLYAVEAVTILASLPSRTRIDLLVVRPISTLSKAIEKMENNQERAEQSSGQLPSM